MNMSILCARPRGYVFPAWLLVAVLLPACSSSDRQPVDSSQSVDNSISISPASAVAGSGSLAVVVVAPMLDDSTFRSATAGAFIVWQRGTQKTILEDVRNSATQRTATVPARLLGSAGTVMVYVGWWDGSTAGTPRLMSSVVSFTVEPIGGTSPTVCTEHPAGIGTTPVGEPLDASNVGGALRLANGEVLLLGNDTSAQIYDPADNAFVPTGSMSRSRSWRTATLLRDGTVLVTGKASSGEIADADIYDPATGVFTPVGAMNEDHVAPTATLLLDGRVLFTGGGGHEITANGSLRTADVYDPGNRTFSAVQPMHETRRGHTATLLGNGTVLIVGGRNGDPRDSADDPPWDPIRAEIFNPATNTFARAGATSSTRYDHVATLLSDGHVLLLGGIPDGLQNVHAQPPSPSYAEIYSGSNKPTDNPAQAAAGAFHSLPTQLCSRTGFTITLLDTGEVLILGGKSDAGEPLTTAELLDPATGNSIVVGGLAEARAGHSAVRLDDGRVFVVAGTDAEGNAVRPAEIWSRTDAVGQ